MGSGLCGEASSEQYDFQVDSERFRNGHGSFRQGPAHHAAHSPPNSPSAMADTARLNSSRSSKSTQMSEMNYDIVSESRPIPPPPPPPPVAAAVAPPHAASSFAAQSSAMNQTSILGNSVSRASREEDPNVHARMVRAERMDGQEEALDERPFRQEKVVRVPTKAYLRPPKSPNQVIADPDADDSEYEYA